jgi:hypothetical protein
MKLHDPNDDEWPTPEIVQKVGETLAVILLALMTYFILRLVDFAL